jgi:hypothetical protein
MELNRQRTNCCARARAILIETPPVVKGSKGRLTPDPVQSENTSQGVAKGGADFFFC